MYEREGAIRSIIRSRDSTFHSFIHTFRIAVGIKYSTWLVVDLCCFTQLYSLTHSMFSQSQVLLLISIAVYVSQVCVSSISLSFSLSLLQATRSLVCCF